MGGGHQSHGVGAIGLVNFCHPEVVKLQQQCQMQNTIFDLPHTGSILFFLGEGKCQYLLETETGELEGKMKMTIITLMFGFFMALGRHSGFRHVL